MLWTIIFIICTIAIATFAYSRGRRTGWNEGFDLGLRRGIFYARVGGTSSYMSQTRSHARGQRTAMSQRGQARVYTQK